MFAPIPPPAAPGKPATTAAPWPGQPQAASGAPQAAPTAPAPAAAPQQAPAGGIGTLLLVAAAAAFAGYSYANRGKRPAQAE